MIKFCENPKCILAEFETQYPDKKYCCKQCAEAARIQRRRKRQRQGALAAGVSLNKFIGKKYHKSSHTRSQKRYKQRNSDVVYEDKINKGCSRCIERRPACLDYHHTDPSTKKNSISTLVSRGSSLEKLKAEMDKCVLLCANCHRLEEITHSAGVGASYRLDTDVKSKVYVLVGIAPVNTSEGERAFLVSDEKSNFILKYTDSYI
jgi:hypothetical protein